MRLSLLALSLALCSSSFAWPWPPSFQIAHGLVRRQDGDQNTSSSQSKSTAAPGSSASTAPTATPTNSNKKPSGSATGSAKPTDAPNKSDAAAPTGGSSDKNNTDSSSGNSTTVIPDDRDPPGGIAMLTPASTTTTYYKIGDDVTLVWNYTSLLVTPSRVNVVASNTAGIWTLTANASVQETNSVVWRTQDDEGGANPLLTDKYTLVVYDAQEGQTAAPKPGHLSSFLNFQFGMYLPRPYTPLPDFVCATCSGAMSVAERQTLTFVFAMGAITVLSFSWFANGFLGCA